MNKRKIRKLKQLQDLEMLSQIGDSFIKIYEIAGEYRETLDIGSREHQGFTVATLTILGRGLELKLKLLLFRNRGIYLDGHKLDDLFKCLSPDIQHKLDIGFENVRDEMETELRVLSRDTTADGANNLPTFEPMFENFEQQYPDIGKFISVLYVESPPGSRQLYSRPFLSQFEGIRPFLEFLDTLLGKGLHRITYLFERYSDIEVWIDLIISIVPLIKVIDKIVAELPPPTFGD